MPRSLTPTILLAAGALAGCEQAIDLGDAGASQIVIESRLRVGATVEVEMQVRNSFGAFADAAWLDQTSGTLTGSDGSRDSLRVAASDSTVAVLVSDSLTVAEGATYVLQLQAPGFAPLTSVTTVPQAARLGQPPATDADGPDEVDSSVVALPLVFDDVPGDDNYFYLLVALADGAGGAPSLLGDGKLSRGSWSEPTRDGTWLFDDRGFADETYVGQVEFDAAHLAAYDDPVAIIELRTVSRAYYSHLRANRQRAYKPALDPYREASTDNVVGGGGLFGSYSVSVVRQSLK